MPIYGWTLIKELEQVGSEQALEMKEIASALYYAKCVFNYQDALNCINDAIKIYCESPYPLVTKFDICLKFRDFDGMEETIRDLENLSKRRNIYAESISRAKCLYHACKGDAITAMNLINNELRNYPESSKERLKEKINNLSTL